MNWTKTIVVSKLQRLVPAASSRAEPLTNFPVTTRLLFLGIVLAEARPPVNLFMSESSTQVLEFPSRAKSSKRLLQAHGFLAEFFVNEQEEPPVHHYVVMRKGSVEILGWGQERSAEAAERQARHCMESLRRRTSAAG